MKFQIMLCSLVMVSAASFAKDVKSIPEAVATLEVKLKAEKDASKQFYLESDILHVYLTEPVSMASVANAKSHAEETLKMAEQNKKDWNYGNAVFAANQVLGRISLVENNVEQAKKYLDLSAQTPGSPQLDTFGPNMTLAKELLAKNEKEAVLKYLDACLRFWHGSTSRSDVSEWRKAIESGKTPDFGANLSY